MKPGKIDTTKALLALTLALLFLSSLAQQYLGHTKSPPNVDFYVYFMTGEILHQDRHANIYEGATGENPQMRSAPATSALFDHARSAGLDDIDLYLYPPLLADLFAPLPKVPAHLAADLWRAFNIGLVLISVLLLARMLSIPVLTFEFAVLAVAAFSFFPIHESIFLGQITICLLALWTVGIVAYFDDLIVLSAAAFAVATVFKVTPVLVVPLFLIWKDRRWLVSYLGILLGLVAAMAAINGFQVLSIYPSVMSSMGGGIPAMANKSLSSLVAWMFYGKVFTMDSVLDVTANPLRSISVVSKILSGLFYSTCLFFVWRSRHVNRESKTSIIAVFAIVATCVSPVAWRHGYSVAFIALAVFWVKAMRLPTRKYRLVLLSLTASVVGCFFFDLAPLAPLPQPLRIIMASLWVVLCILFCLDTLYNVNRDHPESARAPEFPQSGTDASSSAAGVAHAHS